MVRSDDEVVLNLCNCICVFVLVFVFVYLYLYLCNCICIRRFFVSAVAKLELLSLNFIQVSFVLSHQQQATSVSLTDDQLFESLLTLPLLSFLLSF